MHIGVLILDVMHIELLIPPSGVPRAIKSSEQGTILDQR